MAPHRVGPYEGILPRLHGETYATRGLSRDEPHAVRVTLLGWPHIMAPSLFVNGITFYRYIKGV